MQIELITEISEFLKLETQWEDLLLHSSSSHINLSFYWIKSWIETFWKEQPLFILVAYDKGSIVGIAPFVIHHKKSLPRLKELMFMASGVSDHNDFIIREPQEKVLNAFFNYLYENSHVWDTILLGNISCQSSNFKGYKSYFDSDKYCSRIFPGYTCPQINLFGGYENFQAKLSTKLKSDLRKKSRKLNAENDVNYNIKSIIDDNTLDQIINIEIVKKQSNSGYHNLFTNNSTVKFCKNLFSELKAKDYIRIFTINAGNKIISYVIGFVFDSKMYFWTTSFDSKYSKYSPGMLLFNDAIKYCFDNNIKYIDFMAGKSAYKLKWTDEVYQLFDFRMCKKSFKTNVLCLDIHTRKQLSNIKRKLKRFS